MNATGIDR